MAADSAIIALNGGDGASVLIRVEAISCVHGYPSESSGFRSKVQFIGGDMALVKQTADEILEKIREAEAHREDSDFVILNEQIQDIREKLSTWVKEVTG